MKVRYVAYDAAGRRVTGAVESESPERAEEALAQAGLVVTQVRKELQLPSLSVLFPTILGVKPQHLISFSRGLATLLEAGIALRRALPVLSEQTPHPQFRQAIRGVLQGIEEGKIFSEACGQIPTIFPNLYVRLLHIGEETGRLAIILHQLADHMEKEEAAKQKIRSAWGMAV